MSGVPKSWVPMVKYLQSVHSMDEHFCKSVSNVGLRKSQKGPKIVKKVQKYGGKCPKKSKGPTDKRQGPKAQTRSKFPNFQVWIKKVQKTTTLVLAEEEIVVAMYKQICLSSQSPCLDGETGETFPTFVAICQGDGLFVIAVLFIFYLACSLKEEPGEQIPKDLICSMI